MKWILIFISTTFLSFVQAQELVQRDYRATSSAESSVEAKREIQEQIYRQVAEEMARQILGDEKFLKNRNSVLSQLTKNAGRYIPFQKPGALQKTNEGSAMTVALKINTTVVRQILQQSGFLNENESAPVLLPVIQVVDRVQLRSDRWWNTDASQVAAPLRGFSRRLEGSLKSAFTKAGFFMMRPISASLSHGLPEVLRSEKHSPEDLKLLGDWLGAPLVIDGLMQMNRAKEGSMAAATLDIRLQVIQVSDGRSIADVSRTYDTDPGQLDLVVERKLREITDAMSADLASQVSEAWQKGAVGSTRIRLNFTQHMPLSEIEKLKKSLLSSSLGLRTVRERKISASGVVFEVESPATIQELSSKISGYVLDGKTLKAQLSDDEIRIQISR